MPTFTTIALENLLQPRNSFKHSLTQPSKSLQNHHHEEDDDETEESNKSKPKQRLNHIYISPALYATPEPTPILGSSSSGSLSPSPYVFNRKGRGRGGGGNFSNPPIDDVFEIEALQSGKEEPNLFGGGGEVEVESKDDDDFMDSLGSNDCGRSGVENMSLVSNQFGEFYDATEDFSSDGSLSNVASCRDRESELCATRLSLLEEIEKRKTAEDALVTLCTHGQRVRKLLLFETGLTFPAPSNGSSPTQLDINAMEQFFQEIIVVRFVAEAIGKGEAQAEAELAASVIIESKDQEISRLRDKLQYYEAMIHEMSQKNLESMEGARRERDRKRGQRKWLWSCLGMSIVIGASVIAYSYAPHSSEYQRQPLFSDPSRPEAGCN